MRIVKHLPEAPPHLYCRFISGCISCCTSDAWSQKGSLRHVSPLCCRTLTAAHRHRAPSLPALVSNPALMEGLKGKTRSRRFTFCFLLRFARIKRKGEPAKNSICDSDLRIGTHIRCYYCMAFNTLEDQQKSSKRKRKGISFGATTADRNCLFSAPFEAYFLAQIYMR